MCLRKPEQPDRRHAQKPARPVSRGGPFGALERRTHKSRRRRACRRPAAARRRRVSIARDPHEGGDWNPGGFVCRSSFSHRSHTSFSRSTHHAFINGGDIVPATTAKARDERRGVTPPRGTEWARLDCRRFLASAGLSRPPRRWDGCRSSPSAVATASPPCL
jgi:hypothetical protein